MFFFFFVQLQDLVGDSQFTVTICNCRIYFMGKIEQNLKYFSLLGCYNFILYIHLCLLLSLFKLIHGFLFCYKHAQLLDLDNKVQLLLIEGGGTTLVVIVEVGNKMQVYLASCYPLSLSFHLFLFSMLLFKTKEGWLWWGFSILHLHHLTAPSHMQGSS